MRVSRAEEYGIRLVIRLAESGSQLTVRELANLEALPEPTVAKVISRLRRGGVVSAERGRYGGYSLTRPAEALTLATVVGAFDTTVYDGGFCDRMNPGDRSCAHSSSCGLRPVWRGLTAVIGNFLAEITVADIVRGWTPESTTEGGTSLPLYSA